ncbi:MAG: helix-turn-helix transcriptional regulator [Desulfobacula sp.]|jgi:transcriptional regulator with XRE-family HTH domain|uniref:helix-turn-helix domain-containing protein n=1 Tax=Desulfobacula sp. TaxID=2593537 RepID=UPI0039B8C8CE|nr:helix-turn-helix transcriptional regulator [Desulfobacula sp.]
MDFKKAREKLGMTQIDVSKAVGVSVVSYRLWEQGGGKPTPENLKKLKKVLRIKD